MKRICVFFSDPVQVLKVNAQRIGTNLKKSVGCLCAFASVILLFVDKDHLGIDSFAKGCIVLAAICGIAAVYSIIDVIFYKKVVYETAKIEAEYGDIIKEGFKKKTNKQIVVIPVNTTFDTIVDENVSAVDKPLVSSKTIHGQWILKILGKGISIADLDHSIEKNINLHRIQYINELSAAVKNRGKRYNYPRGTVVEYEYENTIFYLLALSEFDANNNAQTTKMELVEVITKLIEYYDQHGNGYDLLLPLMGSGQSRAGMSLQESLDLTIAMLKLYLDKLHGKATIVVYYKDKKRLAL